VWTGSAPRSPGTDTSSRLYASITGATIQRSTIHSNALRELHFLPGQKTVVSECRNSADYALEEPAASNRKSSYEADPSSNKA